MGWDRDTADLHIGKQPDQQPRRRGDGRRPPQDEQRPVEDGADDDFSHLRPAIGRQLQRKGRGTPFRMVLESSREMRKVMSTPNTMTAVKSRAESTDSPRKKEPPTKNMEMMAMSVGETGRCRDKVVGDDGDEAFSGAVNDAAAHDACGVAAKAHAHGQRLLPQAQHF